ncbi:hypothetical protein WJX84_009549 [Apatococcus fuscideae]|uniref:Trs120/TRAPPC9 N-terminal domain-containing protein n=1 Tax=Apatococcus fuscideae TaxID=2026836 RepID=A0AAW1SLY2_9CHLO
MTSVQRIIEPGLTAFSAAEIHVAVVPIGLVPQEFLDQYLGLITKHRQVDLGNVRSFYKESQKSPFKFFPWKTGSMHFRFLSEEAASRPQPLAGLHVHRKTLAIIGILHCPAATEFKRAYVRFEQVCRAYPDAFAIRCFAFEPSDMLVTANKPDMPNLVLFPPVRAGGLQQLEGHAEVVMHDFAASLLGELEKWMLTASPAMVSLNTFADSSDKFLVPSTIAEEVSKRLYNDEEMIRKRRYGRCQKAMGDTALLAGSPADAAEHYNTAAELCRLTNDLVWTSAALEGLAHSKVLESCIASGALRDRTSFDAATTPSSPSPSPRNPRIALLQAEHAPASVGSHTSSGFAGRPFWHALRQSNVEHDVRTLFADARQAVRRKGAIPLLVEQDLKFARFLAGLHGSKARKEVGDLMNSVVETGAALPLTEDKLMTLMEAAQVMGLVGSARKRVLLLWQAIEFSRVSERPNISTLQIARKALEPPDDPLEGGDEEAELFRRKTPVAPGVPRHWAAVRCGCIESVLNTAILAAQHSDVWDAAALLLREHCSELLPSRQESLLNTLAAAAHQMGIDDRQRSGPGPPPLLIFCRCLPLPEPLRPQELQILPTNARGPQEGPFIYSAFGDRQQQQQAAAEGMRQQEARWVAGEMGSVEIEISNPTTMQMKVDRLALEAEHVGDPSIAPRDQALGALQGTPSWRTHPVALFLPPETPPTKVVLKGAALRKGLYVMTGCSITSLGATWRQKWSLPAATLGQKLQPSGSVPPLSVQIMESGGLAEARVTVVQSLPLLEPRLHAPPPSLVPATQPESDSVSNTPEGTPKSSAAAAPSASKSGGPKPLPMAALKGQVLHWAMLLSNAGSIPVTSADVQLSVVASAPASASGSQLRRPLAQGVQVTVGSQLLARALPLLPSHSGAPSRKTQVPLLLYSPQVVSQGEEMAWLELRLEYSGPRPALSSPSSPASPDSAPSTPTSTSYLGRRSTVPIQLRLMPSLQVKGVALLEHHEAIQAFPPRQEQQPDTQEQLRPYLQNGQHQPQQRAEPLWNDRPPDSSGEDAVMAAAQEAMSAPTIRHCCVVEDALVYGARLPSGKGHPTRPQHLCRKTIPAQQQATVAAFAAALRPPQDTGDKVVQQSLSQESDPGLSCRRHQGGNVAAGQAARDGGMQSSRQPSGAATAAATICQQLALFWCLGTPPLQGAATADLEVEAGMLLLEPAAVQAALLPRPLSLLLPPALSIAFHAVVPSPGHPDNQAPYVLLQGAGESKAELAGRSSGQSTARWGMRCRLGEAVEVQCSVGWHPHRCHPAAGCHG